MFELLLKASSQPPHSCLCCVQAWVENALNWTLRCWKVDLDGEKEACETLPLDMAWLLHPEPTAAMASLHETSLRLGPSAHCMDGDGSDK